MSLFRNALKLVSTPSAPMQRQRLRAALTARDRAEQELQTAQAAVVRVENLVSSARAADRRARSARAEAGTAAKQWAASGADPADAGFHEHLAALALDAEHAADAALELADAAAAGLVTVKEAESERKTAVDRAHVEINEAVGVLLVDRLTPQIEMLQQSAAAYSAARLEVQSLYRLMYARRQHWRDDAEHESAEAAETLRAILSAAAMTAGELDENALRNFTAERTQEWRALAKRLAADPDATL